MIHRKRKPSVVSKLGCVACKQRRIKCDERKPRCQNCTSAGYKCGRVNPGRFSISVHASNSLQRAAPNRCLPVRKVCEAEQRSFEFYICHARQNAHDIADVRFWLEFIPRLAMFEDTVYYAVLTIAHITEYPTKSERPLAPVADTELGRARHAPAWTWYRNSLKAMHTDKAKNAPLNVLSCILYARIEMLQGRGLQGLGLLQRAFALNRGEDQATDSDLDALDSTLPILAKTMLPLGSFGRFLPAEQRQRIRRSTKKQQSVLMDFMIELYDLVYQVQMLYHTPVDTTELRSNPATVIARLLEWKAAVNSSRLLRRTDEAGRRSLAQLLVLYHTQYVRLCTMPNTKETMYDAFEADFTEIVSEARIALGRGLRSASETTYDMTIVPCLYFTAWACRYERIRRQAISLLRESAPRCEHLWTMPRTVDTLEMLVAYEDHAAKDSAAKGNIVEANGYVDSRIPVPKSVAQSQVPTELATRLQKESVAGGNRSQ